MNSRFLKIAVVAGASLFCVSSFAQWTRSAPSVRLQYNTDKVGIGIQIPTAKLHVKDTTTAAGTKIVFKGQSANTSSLPAIALTDGSATRNVLGLRTGDIAVDNSGKVGIGVSAPSEKLEVNGIIKCTSVKIGTWVIDAPDYVFAPDYKLRSLAEVEKHINAQKHLPEVPSAAEMKANGVDLSTMNMTLLKKVEELTLYAIDQNKKIEAQQKDIQELKTALLGKR